MPYPFPTDVRRLVDQQLASGAYQSEGEELREALRSLSGKDGDLAALEEAIATYRREFRASKQLDTSYVIAGLTVINLHDPAKYAYIL